MLPGCNNDTPTRRALLRVLPHGSVVGAASTNVLESLVGIGGLSCPKIIVSEYEILKGN